MGTKAQSLLLILLFLGTGTVGTTNDFRVASRLPESFLVSHQDRIEHAKELLGGHYRETIVENLDSSKAHSMEEFIFHHVLDHLNQDSKGDALSLAKTIIEESRKYEMDPIFVLAIIQRESRYNALARGLAGEIGLMQIKPKTAKWIADRYKIEMTDDLQLENPAFNVKVGLAYLDMLRNRYDGESALYISAYNVGPKKLNDIVVEENIVPKEYTQAVLKNYKHLYRSFNLKIVAQQTETNTNVVL